MTNINCDSVLIESVRRDFNNNWLVTMTNGKEIPYTIDELIKDSEIPQYSNVLDYNKEKQMNLKIKKLDERTIIPEYKTSGAAGMDVCVIDTYTLAPGEFKIFQTGLAMAVDEGYEIQVRPRSGLACKKGVTVINSPGTLDSDYVGQIGVGLINHSKEPITINEGDRVAQLVVNKIERPNIQIVDELEETERGSGGFGSTGDR